ATLYVPGPSLTEAVARRGPLSETAVLWLTAGIAEALQVIHGAGIVHRDLKPSNVLLASDGPRVIDFGIARAVDATAHTATGATIGTPHFMAPEQASGGEVSAAPDVFALAPTAAFAAPGRPPSGHGPGAGGPARPGPARPRRPQRPAPLHGPRAGVRRRGVGRHGRLRARPDGRLRGARPTAVRRRAGGERAVPDRALRPRPVRTARPAARAARPVPGRGP